MKKYLVALAVIFGFAIYVAIQDRHFSVSSAQQSTNLTNTTADIAHDDHATKQAEDSKGERPRWYRLFAWPEGITTWAIILTLVAIAEQARESAKATKAMEGQVKAQLEALRPRLTVGFEGAQFPPMHEGRPVRVVSKIINTGGTPDYRVTVESWIEFLPMPFVGFTAAAVYHKGDSFPVYPTQPIIYPVYLGHRLTQPEIACVLARTHSVCLRMRLSYESFGDPKFCDFVFGVEPDGVATLKGDAN